jgi:hypothetical protein
VSKPRHLRRVETGALLLAIVSGLLPSAADAQTTTKDKIDQAVAFYEKFEIESARPLLQEVLSPTWLQPITLDQRVTAYKYLGASYAVIGKKDTAVNYFTAALAYDAFTDLDRNKFSPQELAAFDFAKTQIFRVGMKPLAAKVIDPRSIDPTQTSFPVRITTTQRAEITVTVALKRPGGASGAAGDSISEEVFRGTNDGTQTLAWRGTIAGQLAPQGNYEMRIVGTPSSLVGAAPTTDKLDFTVRQSYEPLEDTLPALVATDTVVASYDPRDPLWDFVKGASLGVAVATIAKLALDDSKIAKTDKGNWNAHWAIASGAGFGAGLFAFSYRRQHLLRPEAVAENAKRRLMRAQFNQDVRARNADRLAKTKLIIQPR